jgi:D-alanyl-D-alanine carboxypeptidase (penicillin-binding protein 5/6)
MRDTNPYRTRPGDSRPPRPAGSPGPRHDARPRRGGGGWLRVLALLTVAAVAGWFALVKLVEPRAAAAPPPVLPPSPSPIGSIAWPMAGVSAAGVSAAGFAPRLLAGQGTHRPVPVASVAKLMTAYVIVHDHPLGTGAAGPQIVVRPDEAAAYPAQARNGDSLVPLIAGEQISERQALVALLLPSADNMAWILARWDAGSQRAFVARMNDAARRLGMTGTRYTDPSGLAASTVSTASDQVLLGRAVMAQPVLAGIVATRTAVLPVAGPVQNINRLLGSDQIVGLKTGSTSAAGGCVLLAAWHRVSGRRVLVIAAVFGQPGPLSASLANALAAGQQLVLAVDHALDHPARAKSQKRSAAPADEADSREDLRLDDDDVVHLALHPGLKEPLVASDGRGLADQPGHTGRDHAPSRVPDQVQLIGLITDDRAVIGGVLDDRGAEVGPDDDGLAVGQVVDRADRGQGVHGERDPAQRHAGQELPGFVFGEFQGLAGLRDRRRMICARICSSPATAPPSDLFRSRGPQQAR